MQICFNCHAFFTETCNIYIYIYIYITLIRIYNGKGKYTTLRFHVDFLENTCSKYCFSENQRAKVNTTVHVLYMVIIYLEIAPQDWRLFKFKNQSYLREVIFLQTNKFCKLNGCCVQITAYTS